MCAFTASDWFHLGDFIFTVFLFWLAFSQLRRLKKTHSIELALSFDKEIAEIEKSLRNFTEAYSLLEYSNKSEEQKKLERKHLRDRYRYTEKVYFDLIDKLCLALLKKYIEGTHLDNEYKSLVKKIHKILRERKVEAEHKNINEYAKKHNLLSP